MQISKVPEKRVVHAMCHLINGLYFFLLVGKIAFSITVMSTFRSWYIYMCLSAVKSLVNFQINTYCTEEN